MFKRLFGGGTNGGPPDEVLVLRRARILAARVTHVMAVPPPDMLPSILEGMTSDNREAFKREFDVRARQLCDSLMANGLWSVSTAEECGFFAARLHERTMRQCLDAMWSLESAACCLWALQLVPELPAYDTQSDGAVLALLPPIDAPPTAQLRSPEELEQARSVAELWHWRSRSRQLVEDPPATLELPAGTTLDGIVRMAAARAAADGVIPEPRDEDFPAFGKAYRDLSAEEYSIATSIAMERHRALNWLCGRASKNRWDKTPLDT